MNEGRGEGLFILLSSLFVGLLIAANVIAVKPVLLGSNAVVPAAVLTYAVTFLLTDTIGEIWGRKRTTQVVLAGFVTSIVCAAFIRLALVVPGAPFWEDQGAFVQILGGNARVVVASMLAYLVSQLHDVWAFDYWKRKTGGKHLWLRNNASTLVSQALDTSIFIFVAFYGVWPELIGAMVSQYVVKAIIALLDTPVIYWLVAAIRRSIENEDVIRRAAGPGGHTGP